MIREWTGTTIMAASLLVGLLSLRPNDVSTDCWALSSIAFIDCCYVCTLYSYSQIIIRGRPAVTISNEGGTMVQSPGQPHIITPWRLTCPLVCPWHCLSPPTISPICLGQPQKGHVCLRFLLVLIFTTDKAPRLYISIVIWILSSDTIFRLNQCNRNSEAAMMSTWQCCRQFWPPGIRDNRGLIWSPLFWIWGAFVIIRSTILLLWVEKQLWLPGE